MRMMFTGVGRLMSNLQEVIELFQKLRTSDNWVTERARLEQMYEEKSGDNAFMWQIMGVYGRVSELYQQGLYKEAGEELAVSLFPTKREKQGNVQWPMLPWVDDITEGEEISGLLTGLLYGFAKEEKFDNLVQCVTNQDRIVADITSTIESLFLRSNDDVIESVAKLRKLFNTLDKDLKGCNENTRGQVNILQEMVD